VGAGNRIPAWWYGAAIGAVLLVLTGCGSSRHKGTPSAQSTPSSSPSFGANGTSPTAPGGGSAPVGKGYLASDDATYADFIQWTETSGGAVYGTIQEDALGGTPPSEAVSTTTNAVTGQITGTNVSLSIGLSNEMFGTYSHGVLRLNIPQQDGTLALSTFTSASSDAFNQVVKALQLRVYNDNQTAQVQQEVASQESAIDKAASTVKQDLSTLASDQASIASAVADFPKDLTQGKTDLATAASDEQKVLKEAPVPNVQDPAQTCSDAVSVNSDAVSVNSDAVSVNSDAIGVESSLGPARNDIATTQQDLQSLVAAQKAQPTYQDGAPTAADVAQVVGATNAAISSAVATANGDISTANQYTAQAFQDANAASAAGQCGDESTPPTPESPIQ
jgi:hypothetical protein